MNKTSSPVSKKLREILEAERDLLKQGMASDTLSLAQEKMSKMQEFQAYYSAIKPDAVSTADLQEVAAISQLARENAILFEAVRNGLNSVIERLEGLSANSYVGAYDKSGSKVAFNGAQGRYVKKI